MGLDGRIFRAVIFDVDGTLVDSRRSLTKAWTQWAQEFRVLPDPSRNWNGLSSAEIVAHFVPAEKVQGAVARIDELETAEVSDTVALPGAAAALRAVGPEHSALATSGIAPVARARLGAAGLEVPPVVVTASDVEHGKPAPDLFLLAAQKLGVPASDCLVVEDAPAGVAGARLAGCGVIALLTSSSADELTDADLVVSDLSKVAFRREGDEVSVSRV